MRWSRGGGGEGREGKGREGSPFKEVCVFLWLSNRIFQIHVVGGLVPSLIRLGSNSSDNFEMCKIAQRGHVPRSPARGGGWEGGGEERGKGRRGRRRVLHVIERVSQREMSLRHSVVESTTEDLLLKMSY